MKNFKIGFLVLAIICSLTACDKNKDATPSWQANMGGNQVSGTYSNSFYSNDNKSLTLGFSPSAGNDYPSFLFSVYSSDTSDIKPGTFIFSGANTYLAQCDSASGYIFVADQSMGHGQLVISKFDLSTKTITGTFNFTGIRYPAGTDSLVITNGSFTDMDFHVTF